jgi:hypothetical protein
MLFLYTEREKEANALLLIMSIKKSPAREQNCLKSLLVRWSSASHAHVTRIVIAMAKFEYKKRIHSEALSEESDDNDTGMLFGIILIVNHDPCSRVGSGGCQTA